MGSGPSSLAARIYDMLKAIEAIESIGMQNISDKAPEPWLARLATERAIEIISEASRHIPSDLKADYPDIRWKNIAGIGNILRHDYQGVRDSIIVTVTQDEIPILKGVLLQIRDRLAVETISVKPS